MTAVWTRGAGMLALVLAAALTGCNGGGGGSLLAGSVNPPNRPAGTVQGTVISSVDNRPIPNATIIVVSDVGPTGGFPDNNKFTFGSLTNVEGVYIAPNTPVGLLTVRAYAKGFRSSTPVQYALAADGKVVLDFTLSPGEAPTSDGSAYDPDKENKDDRIAFPYNYDGNFFSYRPEDD